MNRMPLDDHNRTMLTLKICKIIERIGRREDDMSNITFRVDLLELKMQLEKIENEYEEKTRGTY